MSKACLLILAMSMLLLTACGGKLYLSKIKDGKAGEPQQIDNIYYAQMLGDTIVYIKSKDIQTLIGTLCYYNDGKSSEISKNVYAAFKCE